MAEFSDAQKAAALDDLMQSLAVDAYLELDEDGHVCIDGDAECSLETGRILHDYYMRLRVNQV